MCRIIISDIVCSRSHPCHDWHQTRTTDLILLVFERTQITGVPLASKLSDFVVKLSGGNVFSFCKSKILILYHIRIHECQKLFFKIRVFTTLCPNHDFKRIFIFVCLGSFDTQKTRKTVPCPVISTESFSDNKSVCGSFVMKNNKI